MFNIIEPSPHHIQLKNRYALLLVRETYPIFSAKSIISKKDNYYVPSSDSNTFSYEENPHRDEKEMSTHRDFFYSIVMKKVNELVAGEAARSESKVLILFELGILS